MKLTAPHRTNPSTRSLVLSLPRTNHPCAGLRASSIGTIKNRFGRVVNPTNSGFLNNWTRKLGASMLLDAGVPVPDVVNYGRWRNAEAFTKHYVQRQLQSTAFNDIVAAHAPAAVSPAVVSKSNFRKTAKTRLGRATPKFHASTAVRSSPSTPSLSSPTTTSMASRASQSTSSLSSPLTPSLSPIGYKVQRRAARNWLAWKSAS